MVSLLQPHDFERFQHTNRSRAGFVVRADEPEWALVAKQGLSVAFVRDENLLVSKFGVDFAEGEDNLVAVMCLREDVCREGFASKFPKGSPAFLRTSRSGTPSYSTCVPSCSGTEAFSRGIDARSSALRVSGVGTSPLIAIVARAGLLRRCLCEYKSRTDRGQHPDSKEGKAGRHRFCSLIIDPVDFCT